MNLGSITVNEIEIIEVDTSPITSGVDAEIGSFAIVTDGSGIYIKNGILSTNWKQITPLEYLEYVYIATTIQTRTANTYVAVTELTSISLPAGTYMLRCMAVCQSTSTAVGLGLRFGVGTATETNCFGKWQVSQAANGTARNFEYDQLSAADNLNSVSALTANTNFLVHGEGYIQTSTAGTINIQIRSETTTAVSIRPGSIFFLKRII
jgi:hypothetical protein